MVECPLECPHCGKEKARYVTQGLWRCLNKKCRRLFRVIAVRILNSDPDSNQGGCRPRRKKQ